MSIIRRAVRSRQYTPLAQDLFSDADLSAEGLGVLLYLLSRPDDWQVRLTHLQNRFDLGRDKMQRIMRDLKAAGYADLIKEHDPETGRFINRGYVVSDEKRPAMGCSREPENPVVGEGENTESLKTRRPENPTVGKAGSIPMTERKPNTETLIEPAAPDDDGSEFSDLLEGFWPFDPKDNRHTAKGAFDKLEIEDRRDAVAGANAFCRAAKEAKFIPYMAVYIRDRLWRSTPAAKREIPVEWVEEGSQRWGEVAKLTGKKESAMRMQMSCINGRQCFPFYPQRNA